MDVYTASEQAYKNGYNAGVKELAERLIGIYSNRFPYDQPNASTSIDALLHNINSLVKEMAKK